MRVIPGRANGSWRVRLPSSLYQTMILKAYVDASSPVYETYTTDQGKERKRKRELPPYLTPKEAKLLKKIRKRARRLDRGMNLCGFRA